MLLLNFLTVHSSMSSADTFSTVSGVNDEQRTRYNWVMHCQGCHRKDGTGSEGGAPNMVGVVATFLHTKEGRDFLGRVPGVAFASLPENEVANLLNWLVHEFDKGHLPKTFNPYTADEVKRLRLKPLVSQASNERNKIMQMIRTKGALTKTGIVTRK